MYSTYYKSGDSSRSMISSFGGINRRARIGDGESADMQNMSSDAYPLLCPRKARTVAQKQLYDTVTETVTGSDGTDTTVEKTVYKNLNGILGDVGFCAVWGNDFYYMGNKIDGVSLMDGEKRLLAFGAYILIFPDALYYNTVTEESGEIDDGNVYDKHMELGQITTDGKYGLYAPVSFRREDGTVYRRNCTFDRMYDEEYAHYYYQVVSEDWNGSLSGVDVDYAILSVRSGKPVYLYAAVLKEGKFTKTEWREIPAKKVECSLSIKQESDRNRLWSGDAYVKAEYSTSGVMTAFYVQDGHAFSEYISGIETSIYHYTSVSFRFKARNLPIMDHVCVHENRLWGCHYGFSVDGQTSVNEIYCSALGDFKNWTTGTTADAAWRASVGAYGKWTGCIAMNGRVLFFKDDKIFRVSGTKPSNFQYAEISETGLQSGCERSMSIIDGVLFYKSRDGVYVYDGSTPERISDKLGDAQQAKAAASGSLYGKYYIALDGILYVYDTNTGLWHKEDALNARFFTRYDGALYAAVGNSILCLSGTPGDIFDAAEAERRFAWYAESGDIGLDSPDQKYYKRILIRADGEAFSDMTVTVETDGEVLISTDYTFDRKGTAVVPIVTPRCDHMRYKIGGNGNVKIYSISFETETVGDMPERI